MNAPFIERELDPIELDPRPCELCGLTIDRHEMVDDGEGPEFFCIEADIDDVILRWELADPRDRWRHTGESPPPESVRNSDRLPRAPDKPRSYRTPPATVDAFLYVVRTKDAAGIAEWLADHPRDEKYLQKIWEQKCSIAAAK
jgi:hypothetical protein